MSIADRLPQMADADLATLRDNAMRLKASNGSAQQEKASELLPLIDAELAEREARKPVRAVKAAAKTKTKPLAA